MRRGVAALAGRLQQRRHCVVAAGRHGHRVRRGRALALQARSAARRKQSGCLAFVVGRECLKGVARGRGEGRRARTRQRRHVAAALAHRVVRAQVLAVLVRCKLADEIAARGEPDVASELVGGCDCDGRARALAHRDEEARTVLAEIESVGSGHHEDVGDLLLVPLLAAGLGVELSCSHGYADVAHALDVMLTEAAQSRGAVARR